MVKKIISVRLSEERINDLDEACRLLRTNRSEVIDAAIRLLPKIINPDSEFTYNAVWLKPKIDGGNGED